MKYIKFIIRFIHSLVRKITFLLGAILFFSPLMFVDLFRGIVLAKTKGVYTPFWTSYNNAFIKFDAWVWKGFNLNRLEDWTYYKKLPFLNF